MLPTYALFLEQSVVSLVAGFIEAQYQTEGALVHVLIRTLPIALLLWRWKQLEFSLAEGVLCPCVAQISFGLMAVLFVPLSSTAKDRVALYMLPLQLVMFSRLPAMMGRRDLNNHGWAAPVMANNTTPQCCLSG